MRTRGIFIPLLLTLILGGAPLRQASAGGGGPGCVGWVCGGQRDWKDLLVEQQNIYGNRGYAAWVGSQLSGCYGGPCLLNVKTHIQAAHRYAFGLQNTIARGAALEGGLWAGGEMVGAGVVGALQKLYRFSNYARMNAAIRSTQHLVSIPRSALPPAVAQSIDEADTLPNLPVVGRSPLTAPRKFVRIQEEPYLEFDVREAYLYDDYIRLGTAEGSEETAVAISPWGDIVIFEGKHRAVSAAVGHPVPEFIPGQGGVIHVGGGLPGAPTRLRYEYVSQNISHADWVRWKAQGKFAPVREIIKNPEKVGAALSGKEPLIEIQIGQPIWLQ